MRLFPRSFVGVCTVAILSAVGVSAQAPAAGSAKIGVVNFQKAILDTAEVQKASQELTAKFRPRQETLQKAQQELQDLQTQASASSGKLSASGEADLQAKGTRQQRRVERMTEDLQNDVDAERNEILRRCSTRMQEAVKKLSEERGLDAVIDSSQGIVIFSKPTLDITAEATAAYNKAYPPK